MIEIPSFSLISQFCEPSRPDSEEPGYRIELPKLGSQPAEVEMSIFGDAKFTPRHGIFKIIRKNNTSTTFKFNEEREGISYILSESISRLAFPESAWNQIPQERRVLTLRFTQPLPNAEPITRSLIDFEKSIVHYPEMLMSPKEKASIEMIIQKLSPKNLEAYKEKNRVKALENWLSIFEGLTDSICYLTSKRR